MRAPGTCAPLQSIEHPPRLGGSGADGSDWPMDAYGGYGGYDDYDYEDEEDLLDEDDRLLDMYCARASGKLRLTTHTALRKQHLRTMTGGPL